MTELYTITLPSITTPLRYTSLDIDVTVDNILYSSAPIFRGSINETMGITTNDLTVTWYLKQTDYIPGNTVPIIQEMRNGLFDAASLQLDRLFSPNPWVYPMPNISSDYVLSNRFDGLINIEKAGMTSTNLKVYSYTKLLDVNIPRNTFKPACNRTFCSTDCGVVKANLISNGTVNSTTGTMSSIPINLSFSTDYFNQGVITFLTGKNTGVRRSVRACSNGIIYLIKALDYPPSLGDTFTIYPGCAKTRTACASFSNSNNFRGFPYIPVPETSL